MHIIKDYWNHIAQKLMEVHPEEKSPRDWTKSEAESFLKKLQTKTNKSISATTFRRIFKEGHHGKLETRDIFAQYFDYPTHGDYIKGEIKRKSIISYWWGVAVMLLIGGFLIFNKFDFNKSLNQNGDELVIRTIVSDAISHQFLAFKTIPDYNVQLDKLKTYYVTDKPAYKAIVSILVSQSGHNWTISNHTNPSTAELLNIKIDSLNRHQAFVSTTEHWRLDWFNPSSNRYEYKYEASNDQQYILDYSEQSEKWKISKNTYRGNKFRFVHKYISCDSLIDKTNQLATAKQSAKKAIQNDGLDLALRIMECYYMNHTTAKFPTALSLLMAEKTQLLREVNTDEISRDVFERKKVELFEKILAFLE